MSKQSQLDKERRIFTVTFPTDLTEDRVKAWLSSISGTLAAEKRGLFALPSLVFETLATGEGIEHRLRIPEHDAPFIVSHLESLIPGTHVDEVTETELASWDIGAELHMTNPSRQVRIPTSVDFAHSVLTSVQSLRDDEAVTVQWVVGPAKYEPHPSKEADSPTTEFSLTRALWGKLSASHDEIEDRRKKLDQPNMQAIGRIGVKTPHFLRSKQLMRGVLKDFSSVGSAANHFREVHINPKKLQGTINDATTPRFFPCKLNVSELVPMVSWPIGAPYIAGLPQSRTRHMHVSNAVPGKGEGMTVIGQSNVSAQGRDVAIEPIERMKHVHIIGPIGSGKTALASMMAEQDMQNGNGVVLIETKGDLFQAALERVPANRLQDVIVWDVDDTDFPIGFNVLRQSTSRSAVDELNALIQAMYPESGLMTTGPLYHAVHALAEYPQGTFVDLPTFLSPQNDQERQWREDLVKNLNNKQVKKYWLDYFSRDQKKQDADSAPLQRRMWEFVSRAEIRNSLGQSESSFYMEDVVRDGKILLVNLNGVRIGQKSASLIGTLIMNSVWNAVRTTEHEKPVILYMDEFQNFVTMPTSPHEMLAQSRSFKLGMVLAHQHTGQLKNDLRDAVLANARSKIVFQTTANDARVMASEFGLHVKPEDFMNLRHREAIARVATATGISQPFTMRTKDLSRPSANPRLIKSVSRNQYGRPVHEVEAAIDARRNPAPTQKARRPRAGGVRNWGT